MPRTAPVGFFDRGVDLSDIAHLLPMRYPIRFQLMFATLLVAATAIGLACAASVYLALSLAARRQVEEFRRIERVLARATYPLTENVLHQMRGLSGAEFVLLDDHRRVVFATVALDAEDQRTLASKPARRDIESLTEAPELRLAGRVYFGHIVSAPRRRSAPPARQLVILYGKDQWWSIARRVALPIMGAGLVAILLAIVLTTVIAGWLVRPIHTLKAQAERIAAGQFEPVAVAPRNDELADLAASINQMTCRLREYEEEVRRTEQLRTLDRLGAGMAHTLRNTATGARLAVELFQRKHPDEAASESLGTALHQLELMESFLKKFLRLGGKIPLSTASIDLADVADGAVRLVRPAFDHAHVPLEIRRAGHPIRVKGDLDSLRELTLNLLLNALAATDGETGPAPAVVLRTKVVDAVTAEIRVSDSGPGPKTSHHMFEPFVSEKPEGTGLGLYLSRRIAEAHGGTIGWERADHLTSFVVRLPVAADPDNSPKESRL